MKRLIAALKKMKAEREWNKATSRSCMMNKRILELFNITKTEPYGYPQTDGKNNMILSKEMKLGINGEQTRRNANVLVLGDSDYKMRTAFVEPNILQYNTNFIITDPDAKMLEKYSAGLKEHGYALKVLNFNETNSPNHYNPFHYIKDEKDTFLITDVLMNETQPKDKPVGDPFWRNCERLLLNAAILFVWKTYPESEQTLNTVYELLSDADNTNKIDKIFHKLKSIDRNDLAVTQYEAVTRSSKNVLYGTKVSVCVRLRNFGLNGIISLTDTDDLELESFSDTKQVLFIIPPQDDQDTANMISSLLYSQAFQVLYKKATKSNGLTFHTKLILDGERNISQIPQLGQKMASLRKYDISVALMAKDIETIKRLYGIEWQSVAGNCDTRLLFKCHDHDTLAWYTCLFHDNHVTTDALSGMNEKECMIKIRDLNPYHGTSYDVKKHPNYKELTILSTGTKNE